MAPPLASVRGSSIHPKIAEVPLRASSSRDPSEKLCYSIGNEMKLKVQVWIYREDRQGSLEVLLLRLKPERGGYWQPVTGGVDPGEELSEAALREAQEETGLRFSRKPESLDFQFKFYSPRHESQCEEHVFALQAATSSGAVRLDPHEHVDSRWLNALVARTELKHVSNLEGLDHLLAARKGGL